MSPEAIKKRLRTFIAEELLRGDAAGLDEQTALLELGIVDSMGIMQLTAFVEKEFGVVISHGELSATNFASIDALSELVLRLRK
jgi:acyl carrier protein